MSSKTIFIIVVTILVTIVLMKNTEEVNFWIFGNHSVPKLGVLGVMFGIGLILGYLAGRPRKPKDEFTSEENSTIDQRKNLNEGEEWIDPNDDYIN
jgi:uncharacterized integral membrane protein